MSDKKQPETIKLTSVRVRYAKLNKPGKAYDESQPDEWSVNMYVTEDGRDILMAHGVNPKEDKNGDEYFIAKRKVVNKKGDAVKPPTVVDGKKMPFTEDVGNGSVCNIVVTPFAWEKGKKSGVTLYLNAVQVVNHVTFGANPVDEFDVTDTTDGVDLL